MITNISILLLLTAFQNNYECMVPVVNMKNFSWVNVFLTLILFLSNGTAIEEKNLSIALIAALVATSAFAGFSGAATVGLGYNFETKGYGFSNSTESTVTFELTSEEAAA